MTILPIVVFPVQIRLKMLLQVYVYKSTIICVINCAASYGCDKQTSQQQFQQLVSQQVELSCRMYRLASTQS